MTLGNRDRSTGFCKSQEELMSLITEFDPEDLWRRQNDIWKRTFIAGVIHTPVLIGLTQLESDKKGTGKH